MYSGAKQRGMTLPPQLDSFAGEQAAEFETFMDESDDYFNEQVESSSRSITTGDAHFAQSWEFFVMMHMHASGNFPPGLKPIWVVRTIFFRSMNRTHLIKSIYFSIYRLKTDT